MLKKPSTGYEDSRTSSVLAAGRNHAYLVHSNRIYSFKSSDFDFSSKDSVKESIEVEAVEMKSALRFAPNQTSFCVQGDREIELHHTVLGGQAQGQFNVFLKNTLSPFLLKLDATTGIITLSGNEFMVKAKEALVKQFTTEDHAGGAAGLLMASRKASDPLMHLEGCINPNEIPVSKEISMQVVDQNGDMASIVYLFSSAFHTMPLRLLWQIGSNTETISRK